MDWKARVRESLMSQREVLEKSLTAARIARDNAPAATESHSDTTKSEQERLVHALEDEIKIINGHIKTLETVEVKCVEHDGMKLLLVPEGMGGRKIGDVMLVSVTSPLGKKLAGERV